MTYPPQPPDPYGQQYPPPPPPQPGYGAQYPPPPPPPNPYQPYPQQQAYPQQPYPQQQPYGQFPPQQPPGMYPGGLPPQPPRNNQGRALLIVLGVAVVIGLAVGGVVWFNAYNAPRSTTVSVGTSSAQTPTTSHSSPTTRSSGTGAAGAPSGQGVESPEAVQLAYIGAVNSRQPNEVLALTCPKSHDALAGALNATDSIFGPDAHVIASPGQVTKNGASADIAGHYSGLVNGKTVSRDFSLPVEQVSGRWFLCQH